MYKLRYVAEGGSFNGYSPSKPIAYVASGSVGKFLATGRFEVLSSGGQDDGTGDMQGGSYSAYPIQLGGGWYKLPGGQKVQGKENAEKIMQGYTE